MPTDDRLLVAVVPFDHQTRHMAEHAMTRSRDEHHPPDAASPDASLSLADTVDLAARSSPDGAPVAETLGPLVADEVLGDRYRIRGLIGRGGMSFVYLADDARTGGMVAVKVPREPRQAVRVEREAFAAACTTAAWWRAWTAASCRTA
jgi:hypothetical protein